MGLKVTYGGCFVSSNRPSNPNLNTKSFKKVTPNTLAMSETRGRSDRGQHPGGVLQRTLTLRPHISDTVRVFEVTLEMIWCSNWGLSVCWKKRNNHHTLLSSPPFSCHPERNGHHGVMSVKSNPTQGRARGVAEAGSPPTVGESTSAFFVPFLVSFPTDGCRSRFGYASRFCRLRRQKFGFAFAPLRMT